MALSQTRRRRWKWWSGKFHRRREEYAPWSTMRGFKPHTCCCRQNLNKISFLASFSLFPSVKHTTNAQISLKSVSLIALTSYLVIWLFFITFAANFNAMPKKMNITQKDLDRVKKRCLESLGDFLSELCRDKLMGPTSVEKIFSFDHTTFKRICEKDQTITVKTMARTMGIIASFLNGLKETCDKELASSQ